MAEQVLQATVIFTTGISPAAPTTVALPFADWQVESVELEVPPGPAGSMGFFLSNNGVAWIPRSPGEYIVWDDHKETYYATDYPNASGWEVTGYNQGSFQHAVIVRFHVNGILLAGPVDTPLVLTFVETALPAQDPVIL